MKILHTSDIHLSSPLTTRLSPDKIRERKRELISNFRRMVDDAKKEAAEGFIIAGDLFDSEKVPESIIENLLGIIASAPGITFFYLYGNHEKTLIQSTGIAMPENLKLFGEDWTYFRLGDVNIVGRCETKENMFASLSLCENEKNIVVLHGELRDRSAENGIIGKKELSELPIDYLALGHYHSYSAEMLGHRTLAAYPGTPEGRGFDEDGLKGYIFLDIAEHKTEHRFVKSAKRTLHIVEIDVSGLCRAIDVEDKVRDGIRALSGEDMVRVVLVGTHKPGQKIDTDAVKADFANRFYYFEVKDKTKTEIFAEDYKNDKSLKGEFIRGVLLDNTLSEAEKERVIDMGLAVLMNGEI